MQRIKNNRTLLVGGGIVLATILLMAGIIFSGISTQAAANPNGSGGFQNIAIPLVKQAKSQPSPEDELIPEDGRMDSVVAKWNGEAWEYSTDGGNTWSQTPPEGVKAGDNGSLTIGETKDFDMEAFQREIDSLLQDAQNHANSMMPEGYEGEGSFFRMGDTIARRVEDIWEYSSDGGKTWTAKPPEGFEVSEDGSRVRIGGGEGDINDFDINSWLEKFGADLRGETTNGSAAEGQGIAI